MPNSAAKCPASNAYVTPIDVVAVIVKAQPLPGVFAKNVDEETAIARIEAAPDKGAQAVAVDIIGDVFRVATHIHKEVARPCCEVDEEHLIEFKDWFNPQT